MIREHGASFKRKHPERSAVMYLRVSSKEQEEGGFSIDAQRRLLEGYAGTCGMRVLQVFTDVETAKRAGRSEFGRMLAFLNDHPECRCILVEKTDRLYRNIKDWVTLDEIADLEIHLVKENAVLSENSRSSEKFFHGIKVLMAKNFIDNLREETGKGMLEKARQGIWPSYAPVGYVNVRRADGKAAIEPDPVRAPIVARLFAAYADGDRSLADIVKLARQAGLSTRKTGTYGKAAIHRILRNPLYMGDVVWHGQTYTGVHAPLVSRHLWQTVQDTLDGKRRLKGRRQKHEYPFARLVACGHCGGLMTGQGHRGKVYYHCSGHYGRCPEPYVRQERLEEALIEALRGLQTDEDVLEWVRRDLVDRSHKRAEYREQERSQLQAEYDDMKHRFEVLYEDKVDSKVPAWLFEEKSAEYSLKMAEFLSSLKRLEADEALNVEKIVSVFELARIASDRLSSLTDAKKCELLHKVVLNATWRDGRLSVLFKQPFDILAEAAAVWRTEKVAGLSSDDLFRIWYRGRDLNPYRLIAH
jgi:site-specific DNA recombinase